MNIYRLLLRLYPDAWRTRYEEEFLVVLAAHPFSVAEGIDVIRGAFDAYLHPCLGTTTLPQPERIQRMLSTLRSSLLAIFCAYVSVVLAGLGFQKLTEAPALQAMAQTYSLVGISFHLLVLGAVGALLAVVAGGLPIVLAIIRSALVRRQGGLLLGLAVPVLACSACLGVLFLMKWLAYTGSILLVRGLFFGAPVLTAIVSAGAVCLVVRRGELTEKQLRLAVLPFVLATISMALIAVSALLWGLGLRASAPQFLAGDNGLVGSSTVGTWLVIVMIMALATGSAIISLIRGLAARTALHNMAS